MLCLLGESAAEHPVLVPIVKVGPPTIWKRAKIITCQPQRQRAKHLLLLHLGIRIAKENNAVKHWLEQALLTWRRDRIRSVLIVGFGPPRLVARARQSAYT